MERNIVYNFRIFFFVILLLPSNNIFMKEKMLPLFDSSSSENTRIPKDLLNKKQIILQKEKHGTIILLNGSSSSGKTCISKELSTLIPSFFNGISMEGFINEALEDFKNNSPEIIHKLFFLNMRLHYLHNLNISKNNDVCIEIFNTQKNILDQIWNKGRNGMHLFLAQTTSQGISVIAEDTLALDYLFESCVEILHSYNVLFIKIFCSDYIVNKRETIRSNRPIGWASTHAKKTHTYKDKKKIYDLEIDTSETSPAECAQKIKDFLEKNTKFTAMQKNYEMIQKMKE